MKKVNSKDFKDGIDVYSGIKDYFGNSCLLLVDNDLKEIRIVRKNEDYNKKRKHLDSIGCSKVYTSKYGEVIDITAKTEEKLQSEFPGYKHTQWSVWNE